MGKWQKLAMNEQQVVPKMGERTVAESATRSERWQSEFYCGRYSPWVVPSAMEAREES